VARDCLVVGEVGQVVLAVQVGGAQVDPELARDRTVDRACAAIGAGCARLFLWRKAADLEVSADQSGSFARTIFRRSWMKAMISARPLSPSENLYRGSSDSAVIRAPTDPCV